MKVMFIVPPSTPISNFEGDKRSSPLAIPQGVLAMSSYIRKYAPSNVTVKVYDFTVEANRAYKKFFKDYFTGDGGLVRILEDFNPDIVGISSIFNTGYSYLKPLSDFIRKVCPAAIIVGGGGYPAIYLHLF